MQFRNRKIWKSRKNAFQIFKENQSLLKKQFIETLLINPVTSFFTRTAPTMSLTWSKPGSILFNWG